MSEIVRFSFVYDPAEDRLAMDMADAAGATTRLWLTQRICRGLVDALIVQLQKAAAAPAQAESTVQSWAQAAAMEDFGRTPPVKPAEGTTTGLVHTVQITPSGGQLKLTFEFNGGRRLVGVSLPALRQTLTVIYRLQVAAGWPLDQWPGWIADPARDAAAGAVN